MANFPPEPTEATAEWGVPHTPAEIREHLATQPKPTMAREYNLVEAEFWAHRHIPAGSVICFSGGFIEESETTDCAVLVKSVKQTSVGIWLKVKVLGSADKEFRKKLIAFFKKGKVQVHLCEGPMADCSETEDQACHIDKFFWYPPGDFSAPWLDSAARKAVLSGKELAASETVAEEEAPPRRSGFTNLEDRLRRLRSRGSPHVTFAGDGKEAPAGRRGDQRAATLLDGTSRPLANSASALAVLADARRMKQEPILVPSEDEDRRKSKETKKKSRKRSLEDSLAHAVTDRRRKEVKKEKRSRSRSRRRRKSKSRRRKRSSSSQESKRSRSSSAASSSDSLVPPLKKRAQRDPGSVFRMLENQAVEQLSQDGVLEEDFMDNAGDSRRPKMFTYFQLALKPGLDPKSRDCREISLLARCLDLLREGRLAHLADTLAARLLAVETASKQGWGTAKYLEIYGADEEGPVPAHILLSAQRHQKQVERAGGKGSWPKTNQWTWNEWAPDSRQKGKGKDGKGKGKKGKGKGKSKGGAEAKGESEKPKPGET